MRARTGLPLSLVLLIASAAFASAQDRVVTVQFPPGSTATTLKDRISGGRGIDYRVDARAGQVMQILFKPSNRSCAFNLFEPGADAAAHIGSVGGNEFGKTLDRDGLHRIQISLMRNAARRNETCRFTLSLEITGQPGGVSAGLSDQMMRDRCIAEAAPMYGVRPSQIRLSRQIRKTASGFSIDGTVDKAAEGRKALRCLYSGSRIFDRVMAMTPDGE